MPVNTRSLTGVSSGKKRKAQDEPLVGMTSKRPAKSDGEEGAKRVFITFDLEEMDANDSIMLSKMCGWENITEHDDLYLARHIHDSLEEIKQIESLREPGLSILPKYTRIRSCCVTSVVLLKPLYGISERKDQSPSTTGVQ